MRRQFDQYNCDKDQKIKHLFKRHSILIGLQRPNIREIPSHLDKHLNIFRKNLEVSFSLSMQAFQGDFPIFPKMIKMTRQETDQALLQSLPASLSLYTQKLRA